MKKITFAERRSGTDRRKQHRRGIKRYLQEFWKISTYRRYKTRRAPYVRMQTYTVYMPDRI